MLSHPFADEPTPGPSPSSTLDPLTVTPGVTGFLVTALIIVAVIVLILDMVRRMRRLRYRTEAREKIEAEFAAEDAAEAAAVGDAPENDGTPPADGGGRPVQ